MKAIIPLLAAALLALLALATAGCSSGARINTPILDVGAGASIGD
jgi:hypothetical protein